MITNSQGIESAITQAIAWDEGLVLIEHHDSGYAAKLHTLMVDAGQLARLKIVTFSQPKLSETYNPFSGVSPKVAFERASMLPPPTKEAFWSDVARYTFTAVQLTLALQQHPSSFHMKDVVGLLYDLDLQLSCMQQIDVAASGVHFRGSQWLDAVIGHWKKDDGWDYRLYKQLTMGMVSKFGPLAHTEFSSVLNTYQPQVNLSTALAERQVVVFSVSGLLSFGGPSLFERLVLSDLEAAMAKRSPSTSAGTPVIDLSNVDQVVRLMPDFNLIQAVTEPKRPLSDLAGFDTTLADELSLRRA
jgi:hypothetical protein